MKAFLLALAFFFTGTLSAQTTLAAGDIAITGYNADDPDAFSFVLLKTITAGTEIKFTDNGYQFNGVLRATEGTIIWRATGAMSCGTQVYLTDSSLGVWFANVGNVIDTGTTIILSVSGDQILAYQGTSASPTFLTALNMDGAWVASSSTTPSSNNSALPAGLTDGVNAMALAPEVDNGMYNCTVVSGTFAHIDSAINTSANWTVSDATPFNLPPACTFTCPLAPDCNGTPGGSASVDQCGVCSGGTTGLTPNATCTDCNGVVNGTAAVDQCGICSGGNTGITPNACLDCNGTPNGTASVDLCGVCSGGTTGNPVNACVDCFGVVNGTASVDSCGVCSGGTTGVTPNACMDCNRTPNGTAAIDLCGVCSGGTTGRPVNACVDCAGVVNGTASIDNCNVCSGGTTGVTPNNCTDCNGVVGGSASVDLCGVCSGGNTGVTPNTCLDCNGTPNGSASIDSCGVCSGGTTGVIRNACFDCNNVPNGTASVDLCGVCSGGTTGITPNACLDCNGTPNGTASVDLCGVCSGGTTGVTPNTCLDCNNVPNGTASIDQCGVCSGGNTGVTPNACVDCNGVANGTASLDSCGICSGGTTGISPNPDSDNDGTLDCNDGCPNDINKTAPGACGCGQPDVNLASVTGDDEICAGETTILTATGGGAYMWTTGASTSVINVSPTVDSTYIVRVTNTGGCTTFDTITVDVNPVPTANAGQDFTICLGDTTTLLASGGGTYQWSNGATTANSNVSPASPITYVVTVTDANGCTDTDSVGINVNPLPVANAGTDQDICIGESVTLSGSGGITYNWSTGGTTGSITLNPTQTATYQLLISDANGCLDIDSVTVTVNQLPVVSITGLDSVYCETETAVVLNGTPSGGTFTGAGVADTIFNPQAVGAGNYDITYEYTDANNCSNAITDNTTVEVCDGIAEAGNMLSLKVYPNPFTDQLSIALQADHNMDLQIRLTDLLGKTIAVQNIHAGSTLQTITFTSQTHLASGLYMIQVEGPEVKQAYRVMKAE